MASPTINTEWTADLQYDATASDVETALEALPSITGVTVWGSPTTQFIIIFNTAPQAGANIVPLLIGYPSSGLPLAPPTAKMKVREMYQGVSGVTNTPIHQIRIEGTPTGGAYRLGYQSITTPHTELQIAMMWVDTVLRGDAVIEKLIEPGQYPSPNYISYIAAERLPFLGVNVLPSGVEIVPADWETGFVYAQAKSSDYSASISGERAWSTVFLSIEMQAKTNRYDKRLQAGGIQIDNLFNQKQGEVVTVGGTTYGTILSCDRVSEINTSSVNSKSETIYRKGGVFEIDVKKA